MRTASSTEGGTAVEELATPAFSNAIEQTITGLANNPADTIRQLEIVRDEAAANVHDVRQRLEDNESQVDLARCSTPRRGS
jgi:hypothetical protein